MCTHQAFGHEIRLGQNPPNQPLGVQVGRHVVAQAARVLVTGVLCHDDGVDAGIEEPLNRRLLDDVARQAWPVDPHMVRSPLQHAAKKVFAHWFAGKPNGAVGLLLPVDIEKEWGAGVSHLAGPAARVLMVVVHGAPGCAVRPGLGCEGPLPTAVPSAGPTPRLGGPFNHLQVGLSANMLFDTQVPHCQLATLMAPPEPKVKGQQEPHG